MLNKLKTYVAIAFAVLFFWTPSLAQNYTMSVPTDVDPDWGLCLFEIVSFGNHNIGASVVASMEQEFEGVKTLRSPNNDYVVTWIPATDGGGEIRVETDFKNQFWIELGFCHWTEDHSERSYKKVTGDLTGGSLNEEDLQGPYDGFLNITFDLCGKEDDYSETERLQLIIEEALPKGSNARVIFRGFESSPYPKQTQILYQIFDYQFSHRQISEHILNNAFGPEHPIHVYYGNRGLYFGDCDTSGLWYQVLETEGAEEWGESYTGMRVYAIPKEEGNVMVGYGAAINTALINIFETSYVPGTYKIEAVPESGSPNYWRTNFIVISRGERMEGTGMVRSNSGILTLSEDNKLNTMSGRFEMIGVDHLGRTRSVIGGFRNLTFPK